jgi:hypothetical protein
MYKKYYLNYIPPEIESIYYIHLVVSGSGLQKDIGFWIFAVG